MWYNPSTWSIINQLQGQQAGGLNPSNLTSGFSAASGQAQPTSRSSDTNIYGGYIAPSSQITAVAGATTGRGETAAYTDPAYAGDSGGSSTGGTGVGGNYALYDQSIGNINSQLGRLDSQRGIGQGNIENSYNQAYNRLLGGKATAERDYNTKRQQTIEDNVYARNQIDGQVRNRANGLQRLLGASGAGNSSAALYNAPYAAAREGSVNRGNVDRAYGRNMGAVDTSWQDYGRNFDNSLNDLTGQKYNQQNQLESSIAQTRASLLDQLAGINYQRALAGGQSADQAIAARSPYDNQIQALMAQIDQYGNQYANPVIREQSVNYAAPDLQQYTPGRMSGVSSQDPALSQNVTPYWTLLGDQRKKGMMV